MKSSTELAARWMAESDALPDDVAQTASEIGADDIERMQIADAIMVERATIDALVAALEAVRPVLDDALAVCGGEGMGPPVETSDDACAKIDAALARARKGG